jgi:hypothetical protein
MTVVEHLTKNNGAADYLSCSVNPGVVPGLPGPNRSTRPIRSTTTVRVRKHVIRKVVVLHVAGPLSVVVQELDLAIQLALAEGPPGVVCDLSGMLAGADLVAVEMLATAGRHVRDWPGIPVAVACSDPRVRAVLEAHPLGTHLIARASLLSAVSAVLAFPTQTLRCRPLPPHPTSPRASRDFVTRTLLDWRLGRAIPFATVVVSELVLSSTVNAGTEIDLSMVWDRGALRLTVADHGPALPGLLTPGLDLHGRGLTVVAGLSRSFGVLPKADGGKVVWAVLDAPRPQASSTRIQPGLATAPQQSPIFTDSCGLAKLPFCAGLGRQLA